MNLLHVCPNQIGLLNDNSFKFGLITMRCGHSTRQQLGWPEPKPDELEALCVS